MSDQIKDDIFAEWKKIFRFYREMALPLENSLELMSKIPLIDLFAGAGGLTLGFADDRFCGAFQSVLSVEQDAAASETHRKNFGGENVADDIYSWLARSPHVPAADVVIGGPPCQGFSLLNKNRMGDERREVWKAYMEVVEKCGARIFLMENVEALLKSPEYEEIARRACDMGFRIVAGWVNSANYGAPQMRKRTIVLGWKGKGEPQFPPKPTYADPRTNASLPSWRTVRDAIGDLPDPIGTEIRDVPPPLDLHFGRNPTAMSLQRYKAVPPGGNRFDLQRNAPELTPPCWIRKTSGGTDLFGRLWWDRPSVTIRTEFFKPEKGRYLHPEAHRPITHREAARLMGFPDDFIFFGTKTEIARQIGNAVPPPLAGALARMVLELYKTQER